MIDHKLPKNWKDLQQKVAEIFQDIGFRTELEIGIKTARETVNVDVFSIDESQSPNIVYLCECKHWEKRVPRTIVHAFRTVVQDFGANLGIIVSKEGFQKGAYEAAKNTNIKLADWFGFQDMFEEKWLPAISQKVYDEFQALIDYTEPLIPMSIVRKLDQMDEGEIRRFKRLREKYTIIGMAILHLQFGKLYDNMRQRLKPPITLAVPAEGQGKFGRIQLNSLRDYINCLRFWGKEGLKQFSQLFEGHK